MPHVLTDVARALMQSPLHTFALYLLSNVPGFPPIIQTVHILGITAIMGSISRCSAWRSRVSVVPKWCIV